MKKIFYTAIFPLFIFHVASAQFTKAELRADGLTCSLCSNATYKQLKTLDFIDSVGVDLDHATFLLYFNKDKTVDFEKIRNKVEFAGYTV
ncbi:MAG TPA: heavy-metal-associated domain-containing protein, partial [Bacteroidia bacterium]|nr:heavy-metal-associated domain-containing protein [Bacteroidia bacterium]